MQETDVRHALQEYVTDGEPAMGLTADAMLTAGRRSRRTRRLAGVGGAGLAVALAGAGAAVVTGTGLLGPNFAAASPCPSPPGSRPAGTVAADRALPPELVEWAATSVTCHLTTEVPRLLPAAEYAQAPGVEAAPLAGFSLGGEPPIGNRVDAMALIRDAAGTGDLSVSVGVVDRSLGAKAADDCRRSEWFPCSVRTGPNREIVLLSTEDDSLSATEPRNFVVRVYRGHSEISVQASNTDRKAVGDGPPVATRPMPVLSAEQAVQLALSPELYLFP
ncbi:hypothetical protein [Actinoplanes sp. DH11]|uniref:hypothetical protein n=1 Tax=Actinoplanes sp. DH11 TaxID=2857011 RepID=UPI001E6482B5|nr:hypothetical protein [Actinoplanes sp. DH11]